LIQATGWLGDRACPLPLRGCHGAPTLDRHAARGKAVIEVVVLMNEQPNKWLLAVFGGVIAAAGAALLALAVNLGGGVRAARGPLCLWGVDVGLAVAF